MHLIHNHIVCFIMPEKRQRTKSMTWEKHRHNINN